jgi:hypothetical protein
MCRPKEKDGLSVIDLDKFARALRLRWPWLQWKDPSKAWVENDHPSNEKDMNFFYAATTITIGYGHIANFWHDPWLEWRKPKDIAPSIFAISKRKNVTVSKGICDDFWIVKLNTIVGIKTNHLTEYVDL